MSGKPTTLRPADGRERSETEPRRLRVPCSPDQAPSCRYCPLSKVFSGKVESGAPAEYAMIEKA